LVYVNVVIHVERVCLRGVVLVSHLDRICRGSSFCKLRVDLIQLEARCLIRIVVFIVLSFMSVVRASLVWVEELIFGPGTKSMEVDVLIACVTLIVSHVR